MEHETEYDPVSGVEVETCTICEELNQHFRSEVAYLRRFDDMECRTGVPAYMTLRRSLLKARDSIYEALDIHLRLHSGRISQDDLP